MYLFFKILDLPLPPPSPVLEFGVKHEFSGFDASYWMLFINICISEFFLNVLKREFHFDILSSLFKISQYVAYNLKYPYKTPSASNGFVHWIRNLEIEYSVTWNFAISFHFAEDKKKRIVLYMSIIIRSTYPIKEHYVTIHCFVKPFCWSGNISYLLLLSKNKQSSSVPFIRSAKGKNLICKTY